MASENKDILLKQYSNELLAKYYEAKTVGVINPTGYYLPIMGQLASAINPAHPYSLAEHHMEKLRGLLRELRRKTPTRINQQAVNNFVDLEIKIKNEYDRIPKVAIPTTIKQIMEFDSIANEKLWRDYESLPDHYSEELRKLLKVKDSNDSAITSGWHLTATTIPLRMLKNLLVPGPDIVLNVTNGLLEFLKNVKSNVKHQVYFIDRNKHMVGLSEYTKGWGVLTIDHNGAPGSLKYMNDYEALKLFDSMKDLPF